MPYVPLALRLEFFPPTEAESEGHGRWSLEQLIKGSFWNSTDVRCWNCGKQLGVPNIGGLDRGRCIRCNELVCSEEERANVLQRFYDTIDAINAVRLLYQSNVPIDERLNQWIAEVLGDPYLEQIETLLDSIPFKFPVRVGEITEDFFTRAPKAK